ncbi:VWA domain-containing protein [Streptomyces sp. TRM66268-LWL]|uniref:VWA domain-containing protein n=1 Tax=Streptomyces polyasparticus TaxID=2767826 RepID=A0ABR7SWZ6_9ACTN|nr:substrate-binding and VWA domain-containing protein [Streptomyces polyasparticus]MBC9718843.1 VWA domain-containing protein [Streptomyces polyasparticus]
MGRHNMPDRRSRATAADPQRPGPRRRMVVIATVLVLSVAGSAAYVVGADWLPFTGKCEDDAVRIDVIASPDMAPALRETATYARDKEVRSDGRCMDVRVTARDSSKFADYLRTEDKPGSYEVWVPDSDMWVERVQLQGDESLLTPTGNIASSPVTMGMVPAAAKKLGWPKKTYSWAELAGAATQGDQLRLGAADPARSASGLMALAKISASAQQAGGEEAQGQIAATAKILAQRTSDSDAQALETLARDNSGTEQGNPRRNQALIVSEQAAFKHNASAPAAGKLELFYPKDGAPELDYPYALLDEPGQTTDESRAALRFMTLLGEEAGEDILASHGFRTGRGAPPDTIVKAAGGSSTQPVTNASAEDLTTKQLQETLGVWTITVQSARVSVVVDVSGSMAELVPGRGLPRMEVTKAALTAALSQFTNEDDFGLWEFSTLLEGSRDYRELVPTDRLGKHTGKGGTTQRELLTREFSKLQPVPNGATGLYDTTLAAYKQALKTHVPDMFNTVVIVTDGENQDPGSITRSALIAELERLADPDRPVPLIAVAVGPGGDRDELDQVAKATGGSGHQVDDPAQVPEVILKAITAAAQASAG